MILHALVYVVSATRKCTWIYVDYPHIVDIEDQTLNAQLFMGKTAGHVGTEYVCVKLAPDSRFLIHILTLT